MPSIRRTARGGRSKRCSSRGWAKKAPRTRRQRKRVRDKCGDYCFLGKNMSFPVCSKNTRKCRRDRAGVCAAKYRADQHDYKEIARKARRILAGGGMAVWNGPAMIRPDPSLG
jgi:hypothetical protein